MKIKNADIVIMLNIIAEIKKDNRVLPFKLSYAINKNQRALLEAYKPYEETIREHGWDGLDNEKAAQLSAEEIADITALRALEAEVDMYKLSFEDIETVEGLNINEIDMIQTYMLKESQ